MAFDSTLIPSPSPSVRNVLKEWLSPWDLELTLLKEEMRSLSQICVTLTWDLLLPEVLSSKEMTPILDLDNTMMGKSLEERLSLSESEKSVKNEFNKQWAQASTLTKEEMH